MIAGACCHTCVDTADPISTHAVNHVFISYASEDRAAAARLADVLARQGFRVWWDRRLVPGQAYDHAIETALDAASCVVVLWSRHAVASEWVRNEAGAGAERDVLVPVWLEDVKPPLEFRRRHTLSLVGWNGEDVHAGLVALQEAVAARVASENGARQGVSRTTLSSASGLPQPATSPARDLNAGSARMLHWAVALVALTLAIAVWQVWPRMALKAATELPTAARHPGKEPASAPDLASRIEGRYVGDIVSDSKGPSQALVELVITRIDARTVRLSSANGRLGERTLAIQAEPHDALIISGTEAAHPMSVNTANSPVRLDYSPYGELTFSAIRRELAPPAPVLGSKNR